MKKLFILIFLSLPVLCFSFEVGDRVILKDDARNYSTSERIPRRFSGQCFTLQQVGSRFHDGCLLLKEIYSWVDSSSVIPASDSVNVIEIFGDGVDVFGRRFVVLYDTVYVYDVDTVFQTRNDTVFVTGFRSSYVCDTVFDTIFVDRHDTVAVFDTVSVVRTDTIVQPGRYSGVGAFSRLGVGARGGVSMFFSDSEKLVSSPSWSAGFDLGYTRFFSRRDLSKPYLGISTGLSVSAVSGLFHGGVNDSYSTSDASGDRLDYSITARKVRQSLTSLELQVPLLFSLLHNGLAFDAGVRFAFPVWNVYSQEIEDPHISALYVPYGVTVRDDLYTGVLKDCNSSGLFSGPQFKIYVSLSIGYEVALKSGDSFTVGLYGNWCVYDVFSPSTAVSCISVSKIGINPLYPVPDVRQVSAFNAYSKSFSSFDAGLRLCYNFNFFNK